MTKKEDKALSILQGSKILALRPDSEIREAIEANVLEGEGLSLGSLTRLKVPPQGVTTWTFDGLGGEESAKAIEGVMCYYGQRGVLWPTEEPSNSRPTLVTYDMQRAYLVSDDFGNLDKDLIEQARVTNDDNGESYYDWQKLTGENGPYGWGTAQGGKRRGKRAQESRLVCILRPEDAFPMILNVPPGSIASFAKFMQHLLVPHWRAVVSLELQKRTGEPDYSVVIPTLVGTLSREEGLAIKRLFRDPIKTVVETVQFAKEEA